MRTDILDVVAGLVKRHRIHGFIVPANTGTTARAVLGRFGSGYQYFAVGNPASSHARGLVLHSGLNAATQAALANLGFPVVLQEVSAFQPLGGSPIYAEHAARMQESYEMAIGGTPVDVRGTTLSWIVESTLRAMFGEQVKTCVEITLMAGESTEIDMGARHIALCTPSRYSDLRDCAIVLRPSTTATFFQSPPHIYEIAYSGKPANTDG